MEKKILRNECCHFEGQSDNVVISLGDIVRSTVLVDEGYTEVAYV
jgi:hypothetical protein